MQWEYLAGLLASLVEIIDMPLSELLNIYLVSNHMVCFIKNILLYLKVLKMHWNTLLGNSLSTTGYIFTLSGGAICWKSKKQTIIANSTMEAEFIALASASEKAN